MDGYEDTSGFRSAAEDVVIGRDIGLPVSSVITLRARFIPANAVKLGKKVCSGFSQHEVRRRLPYHLNLGLRAAERKERDDEMRSRYELSFPECGDCRGHRRRDRFAR